MALAAGSKGHLIDACTWIKWIPIILGEEPEHARSCEWIWESVQRGLFKITLEMVKEVRRKIPRLIAELKKRGVVIVIPDKAIVGRAKAMRARFEAEGLIVGRKCVSENDMQFVLIAEAEGMIVVTEEAPREVRCNIPAVCKRLGVPCLSSNELFARYGY